MKPFIWIFCLWTACLAAMQGNRDPVIVQLNSALESNDTAEVRVVKERLLLTPASLSTLLAAGILLAQHEKVSDASVVFERCSIQYPESFEAKYNLALARIALAQYEEALKTLSSISAATVDEKVSVEYLTGKILLNTNHLKEAQQNLATAYAKRPQQENYALDLALLYIRSGAYVRAIRVLEASLAAHPKSEDLALELALGSVLAGNYTKALDICRALQEQDPGLGISRLIVAFVYCTEKSYEACKTEASAGLSSPQPSPYLYYLRAKAGWESGDGAHIMEDVSAAIKQMSACGVCLSLRSRIFEAAHDDVSAIADLKKAVATDAQDASAWYRLSVLYRKEGRPNEAAEALRIYRSIHDTRGNQELESFRKQTLDTMGDH